MIEERRTTPENPQNPQNPQSRDEGRHGPGAAPGASAEGRAKNVTSMQVSGERDIVIARAFDAPARIVFEAWTNPAFVRRWWAPRSHGASLSVCEADVRVGGEYRYVMRAGDGEFAFSGAYEVVEPPTRLVYTQIFEPMREAGAVVVTVTFEEREGKTFMTSREVYPSKEAREAALSSGMEHGMRETMNQLDELAASLTGG